MSTSSQIRVPEIVRQTPVVTDTIQLTVSTIRIARGHYDTVVFDDSADKRHEGWLLAGFVINKSSKRAASRDAAMDDHREALHAARTEEPKAPRTSLDVELRNAAAKLRTLSDAATPGPWCTDSWEIYQGTEYEPGLSEWIGETCRGRIEGLEQDRADATYIAAMNPAVGAKLAQLLEVEADVVAARIAEDGTDDYAADFGTGYLLDIARLINDEEAAS